MFALKLPPTVARSGPGTGTDPAGSGAIVRALHAGEAVPQARSLSHGIRTCMAYVARHYARRITLADLGAINGQTTFQLIRAFHRELGLTPHAYIVRVRLAAAMHLLRRGDAIADVATSTGFVDQTHLTRHFKRMHGRTPRVYLSEDVAAVPRMRKRRPETSQPCAA